MSIKNETDTQSDTYTKLTKINKNKNQKKYFNQFLDDVSIMIDETSY